MENKWLFQLKKQLLHTFFFDGIHIWYICKPFYFTKSRKEWNSTRNNILIRQTSRSELSHIFLLSKWRCNVGKKKYIYVFSLCLSSIHIARPTLAKVINWYIFHILPYKADMGPVSLTARQGPSYILMTISAISFDNLWIHFFIRKDTEYFISIRKVYVVFIFANQIQKVINSISASYGCFRARGFIL